MAVLAVQRIVRSGNGLEATENVAAQGGDSFANTGVEFVHLQNQSSTYARTVTFVTQQTVDGLAVDDLEVTIPPGESRFVGPFPEEIYNDANDRVAMTYDWDGSASGGSGSGSGDGNLLVSPLKF